jgi:hypothetical protein
MAVMTNLPGLEALQTIAMAYRGTNAPKVWQM